MLPSQLAYFPGGRKSTLILTASSTSSGVSRTTVWILNVPLTLPTNETAVVLTLSGKSTMM
jgi:hypothetical protein